MESTASTMLSDFFFSSLFFTLPDDIFVVITKSLSPRDLCSLGLSCRDFNRIVESEKVWLAQCDKLGLVSSKSLIEWREGVCSYKVICRFLVNIQPLLGIWVHQNPELGNLVYVMPGFLSVIGCRIIPQEVGGPTLWSPVFEILCNYDGSTSFFLHGRERGEDYVYPGLLISVGKTCNVLLLEVEPRHQVNGDKLTYSTNFAYQLDNEVSWRLLSKSGNGLSKSQRIVGQKGKLMPFSRLGFGDRRRLLDLVTSQVRMEVPASTNMLFFPVSRCNVLDLKRDLAILYERRLLLLDMHKCVNNTMLLDLKSDSESPLKPVELVSNDCTSKGKGLSAFLKSGLKQILGKSSSSKDLHNETSSSSESKPLKVHEFIQSGDGTIGLSLRATTMKLSCYRAWPHMNDSRFALYKLPMWTPKAHHEFAGLWGGTFGWPPGRTSEDKSTKALFFILISYEESEGKEQLIGTKILEGTSYVSHPNGSAMFIVNTGQPSEDIFPWDTDEKASPIYVRQSFMGEGIANGYGFRYPGSKPGSLFVIHDSLLVFLWKESGSVLTLKRLDLPELLKRGERANCLSPVSNFAYLTKTYSNVFSGFSNS